MYYIRIPKNKLLAYLKQASNNINNSYTFNKEEALKFNNFNTAVKYASINGGYISNFQQFLINQLNR